jgi:prevent-host-death family protein
MRASDLKPITYMKTHSAELIDAVNEKRSPIVITQNGAPRAVMMDVESYERLQGTLTLLKLISQSGEDFRRGRWLFADPDGKGTAKESRRTLFSTSLERI